MTEMSTVFPEMTVEQEKQWWAEQQEVLRIDQERHERMVNARKAVDHHTQCRDCDAFVQKWRWVLKRPAESIGNRQRPLCGSCFDNYDNYP